MKRINKGLSLSYVYFVLNTVLTIVVSAFIVRIIGRTDYGVYQTVTAFVSYLVLLEFGTGSAMSRNLSLLKKDGTDTEQVNKNVSTVWSLTIILSAFIILFAIAFYLLIGNIYVNTLTAEQIIVAKRLFVFAAFNLLCTFLTQTLNGLLIGYENYTFEKTLSLIKLLLRSTLIVLWLFVKPSVYAIVIIDAALSFSVFLITLLYCVIKLKSKLVFKYFDKGVFKFTMPLCFAMLLQTIVNSANGNVDKFLISVMLSPEDVSVYAISTMLFTMYSSVGCIPLSMYMPSVADKMKNGAKGEELTEYLVKPCRLNAFILGILAFGILVVGQQFLTIVYGAEYSESWIYAVIVIFPIMFALFNGVMTNVMDILNKRQVRSFILMITTVFNIGGSILAIKFWGMLGAAIVTGISYVLQTISLNVYYKKKLGINVVKLFKESFSGLLVCLIISAAVSFPLRYVIGNLYAQFFVCGGVFCAVFFVLFLLFGANKEEKMILLRIKNKTAKKSG